MKRRYSIALFTVFLAGWPFFSRGQENPNSLSGNPGSPGQLSGDPGQAVSDGKVTLQECIDYALQNRPAVQQSYLDEEIGERDINASLADWFPQISASASYDRNLKLPTIVLPNFEDPGGPPQIRQTGLYNNSSLLLQADQQILDAGLIQASKVARYIRKQNTQNTENAKINTVVEVSKAFYDILTSEEQLKIIDENLVRIEKQLKDATARYETGLVDKTDYKRATITLRNTQADKKRTLELLKYKYAYLKQLMNYPAEQDLELVFGNTDMEQEILLDTTLQVNPRNRIEYQMLETRKQIQAINTSYQKWSFLPNLSAFINYNWNYQHDEFSKLYDAAYPSSVVGLSLDLPLFQGTRRIQELRISRLQEKRIELDMVGTRNEINTQYQQALATYKANLNDWKTQKENAEVSEEVYDIIKLQYDEGIKTYLDLMTAETDLRTAQINYLNALYSVLSSKLDVQQALGTIDTREQ